MKTVTTEELINYKILPFNIYSEYGEKIFSSGEILTPGKLLQLKQLSIIFRDETEQLDLIQDDEPVTSIDYEEVEDFSEPQKDDSTDLDKIFEEYSKLAKAKDKVVEVFDMNPNQVLKSNTIVDEVSIMNYKGPINKKSKIDPQNQIKLKAFYNETITGLSKRSYAETANLFLNIRDKILQDIIYRSNGVVYSSQIKLIGEYQKCHSLNVAILGGFIAQKMGLNESVISDIVLAGLMHDIGKTRLDAEIVNKQNLSNQEQQQLKLHTAIGYRMLKEDFEMPENIALVALEHHENNDGSGYPMNKSGDLISKESQIIHICNYFDNLSFNRTNTLIKNSKEAVRTLLELGTKCFMPDALYTFIHMFSYNDTTNFEDMIL
ncbi:HD domain-containing protein [bacterium]|nr:HD domain-containing protein [bacterium]